MKRLLIAFILCLGVKAHAQTVYTSYTATTVRIDPTTVNCSTATATRRTGWIAVAPYSAVVFDITYTDANASDLLNIVCESSTSSGTTLGSGMTIPIIVSTASTGIASIVPSASANFISSAGANSGTFKASYRVEPRTAQFVSCLLACTGDLAAGDTIGVNSRTVTP